MFFLCIFWVNLLLCIVCVYPFLYSFVLIFVYLFVYFLCVQCLYRALFVNSLLKPYVCVCVCLCMYAVSGNFIAKLVTIRQRKWLATSKMKTLFVTYSHTTASWEKAFPLTRNLEKVKIFSVYS